MNKAKKIFTNIRVILVLIVILLAFIAIHPNPYADGVTIRNVMRNSSAEIAGIASPKPTTPPMNRERVISMNNVPITNLSDYYQFVDSLTYNRSVNIKTTKGLYKLVTKPLINVTYLNETISKVVTEEAFNETLNQTVNVTRIIEMQKTKEDIIGMENLGLVVYEAPKTNIKKGLDLQGGTRVLLKPEEKLSSDDMGVLLENMKQRLNVFGLSDIVIQDATDLSGNQYILVEIAGANEEDVKDLLAKQGKFESKIGNETVFKGGQDITYVCRTAKCAYAVDPYRGCGQSSDGGWFCSFSFSITLSPEAAQRQADLTQNLKVITEDSEKFLDQKLDLFLDNELVDSLRISADLKGRAVTDIAITGSGALGRTQQEAAANSAEAMKKLQTVLITGSLPVKLNIVRADTLSPVMGQEFVKNMLFIGFLSIITVGAILLGRYRRIKVAIPILFTMSLEIFLLLGFAALVGWNLDLAAIAGIIITIGTGVNDQIVITDQVLGGKKETSYDWKQKIKKAFFIIMGAYLTVVVAMVPLLFAGAGMLKGFALTTIAGISIGVFITRPAYAKAIEILLRE